MTPATMDPIIHTAGLTLIRLTDTSPGSQHVQWFHENWSDSSATSWSLHGPCKSLAESREWMMEHMTKWDNMFYAVFEKPELQGEEGTTGETGTGSRQGRHVGSVSLRLQSSGPTLQPPTPPSIADTSKALNLRVIGYALFEVARGKGYATEANKAMLDAYRASVQGEKDKGTQVFYIEACVDEGNPRSVAVLKKLGFREVGWKEDEAVWLNGEWRTGYWIYGMYV